MIAQHQTRRIRLFDGTSPVWRALHDVEQRLRESETPYVIIALNAYSYPYEAQEVSVIARRPDHERFVQQYLGTAYSPVSQSTRHFIDIQHDVSIHFCLAGTLVCRRSKNNGIRFPDPEEAPIRCDSRVVSLPLLIELKITRGLIRDLAGVVELIRYNRLTQRFAGELDTSVRPAYLPCWAEANQPDYEGPEE